VQRPFGSWQPFEMRCARFSGKEGADVASNSHDIFLSGTFCCVRARRQYERTGVLNLDQINPRPVLILSPDFPCFVLPISMSVPHPDRNCPPQTAESPLHTHCKQPARSRRYEGQESQQRSESSLAVTKRCSLGLARDKFATVLQTSERRDDRAGWSYPCSSASICGSTAFPWPPESWRLIDSWAIRNGRNSFPLNHLLFFYRQSQQWLTITFFTPKSSLLLCVPASLPPCLITSVPPDFYSSHPGSRIRAKFLKTCHITFSTRHTSACLYLHCLRRPGCSDSDLTTLWINGGLIVPPELNRRGAVIVLGKIDEILAWEKMKEQERYERFVELGQCLCEVRAGQYWRMENLKSYDEFLGNGFRNRVGRLIT